MKNILIKALASAAAAILSLGALTACHDVDEPPVEIPKATWEANTDILDLKTQYWDDARNYIKEIEPREDGSHVIIKGTVISSDASGNIYKSLVIRDETAALALSINQSNLYINYRVGQEIVIDATGMYIGKYNGLQQLGYPEWYDSDAVWEATFMPYEFFLKHIQLNGLPDPASVEPITITYNDIATATAETLVKWQSQLVRFDNCSFELGGEATFCTAHKENTNRTINLDGGNSILLRNSGYANFWNYELPAGTGSVTAILSYYGTAWQLLLNSYEGCSGFEGMDEDDSESSMDKPYSVDQVVAFEEGGTEIKSGWVSGYIVGAVKPGTSEITDASQIEWTADVSMPNTLVIGATADSKSLDQALVVELPKDSRLREYGNLLDHPENYKKNILLRGSFIKVLGTYGVNTDGSASHFKIEGVDVPDDEPSTPGSGNGTLESPYSASQALALIQAGNIPADKVYVEGTIVSVKEVSTEYGNATYYISDDGTTANQLYIYRGYYLDGDKFTSADQIKAGDKVVVYGSLMNYNNSSPQMGQGGYIYSLNGQTSGGGTGGGSTDVPEGTGSGTQADPYSASKALNLIVNNQIPSGKVYVQGIIVSVKEVSTEYGNATYYISDDGTTANQLYIYRGYYLGGDKFISASQIKAGDKVVLYGSLMNYNNSSPQMGQGGYIYSLNGQTSGSGTPDTPVTPDEPEVKPDVAPAGDGTQASPYNVARVIALGATDETAYVTGYIVGYVDGTMKKATFSASGAVASNLLIADKPDVNVADYCVPVNLPSKSAVRTALNLADNPGMLGKQVVLHGKITTYFSVTGLKDVDSYEVK